MLLGVSNFAWVNQGSIYRGAFIFMIKIIIANIYWAYTKFKIQSAKTRPGADYGSDHELLIAKFRLKLKKVGKTTRPFKYDLNQILDDYTVEVRNRF